MDKQWHASDVFDVRGRKALITGGTKGLGRAMAECLMQNGCDVTLVGRSGGGIGEMQTFAQGLGVRCHHCAGDVTAPGMPGKIVDQAESKMGRIDILVNSAGMNRPKMLECMDDATWKEILDVNLNAAFFMTREAIRVMRKNRYGKVINISSVKGFFGVSDAGYSAYCSAKGAINMLTKQLACETGRDGITVNAIAPTFIKTDINAKQLEDRDFLDTLTRRIPVGRIGEFRDLMGLLLLLASDASQFITGQTLLLEGGIAAMQ